MLLQYLPLVMLLQLHYSAGGVGTCYPVISNKNLLAASPPLPYSAFGADLYLVDILPSNLQRKLASASFVKGRLPMLVTFGQHSLRHTITHQPRPLLQPHPKNTANDAVVHTNTIIFHLQTIHSVTGRYHCLSCHADAVVAIHLVIISLI